MVINGDSIKVLKQYPDNYFDAVVTDPPYGLGKEPDAVDVMQSWIATAYHEVRGTGFMGKEWDAFVPQPLFWKEVFRVLKHGGHVLSFFGTRTYDWGVMAMRFAGFEVRDTIQWHYGSGFPKSYNISKGIEGKIVNGSASWNDWRKLDGDKEQVNWGYSKGQAEQGYRSDYSEANKLRVGKVNFQSEEAKQWDGWGSALKPASEPIVLARKPLEKGLSIAENVLKYGTGGINIDGCRIGHNEEQKFTNREQRKEGWNMDNCGFDSTKNITASANPNGRFPANLIMTHHPECECKGVKKVKSIGNFPNTQNTESWKMSSKGKSLTPEKDYSDENGEETVEDWNCHPDCPIKILDEQSGISKSTGGSGDKSMGGLGVNGKYGKYALNVDAANKGGLGDSGGASRFFYCAKASKSERNKGLDGFEEKTSGSFNFRNPSSSGRSEDAPSVKSMGGLSEPKTNFHPTVKPIKLMQYLVRLITPPSGILLDPFCGSGTTGIACKLEGFEFVGIEQDAEYCKIAEARINNWVEEKEEVKIFTEKQKKDKKSDNSQPTLF